MRDGGPVRSRFSDEVEDLDPVVEQAAPKGHSSQAKSPAPLGQHTSSPSLAWPAPARIDTLDTDWPLPKLM